MSAVALPNTELPVELIDPTFAAPPIVNIAVALLDMSPEAVIPIKVVIAPEAEMSATTDLLIVTIPPYENNLPEAVMCPSAFPGNDGLLDG